MSGCGHATESASWLRAMTLPTQDAALTSTRDVTDLLLDKSGNLWATTRGGVLRRDASGAWRTWTRRDGLPSHEARGLALVDGQIEVSFPRAKALWDEKSAQWQLQVLAADNSPEMRHETRWQNRQCVATLDGLTIDGKSVPTPPTNGTHISALLSNGAQLWAAWFGDGVWSWDGKNWTRVDLKLPQQAREITALAGDKNDLWLGTRRAGVWHGVRGQWTQHSENEPFDANVQSLVKWRGALWMSTLEDGLQVRVAGGWKHFASSQLSSDAPRQLVVFRDKLWVRHGGGQVDRFDGKSWARDVFKWLPRHKAMAIAADEKSLYVAQWGGWSEWDGAQKWTHHFLPELENLVLVTLLPQADTLWIGTQKRGVAQWQNGKLRWHDERHGLQDDWITALSAQGATLNAGTFVGGMSVFEGDKWSAPLLTGENITALCSAENALFIATRHGVFRRDGAGEPQKIGPSWLDEEAQALCRDGAGLWVGTRTGLFWIADVEN